MKRRRKAVKLVQEHHVMRYVEGEGPAKEVFSTFTRKEAEAKQRELQEREPGVGFYISRY